MGTDGLFDNLFDKDFLESFCLTMFLKERLDILRQLLREETRVNSAVGPATDTVCDCDQLVCGGKGILATLVHLFVVGDQSYPIDETKFVCAADTLACT